MAVRDIIHVSHQYVEHRRVSDDELLRLRIMNNTVVTDSGCWQWQGSTTNGYGTLMLNRKVLRVHRLAHELWCGPIPKGHVVRHKCDNPGCCNPAHIETGTQAENINDIVIRGRFAKRKLTASQVEAIRASAATTRELADAYGVGIQAIRRAKGGITHKHIPTGDSSQGG